MYPNSNGDRADRSYASDTPQRATRPAAHRPGQRRVSQPVDATRIAPAARQPSNSGYAAASSSRPAGSRSAAQPPDNLFDTSVLDAAPVPAGARSSAAYQQPAAKRQSYARQSAPAGRSSAARRPAASRGGSGNSGGRGGNGGQGSAGHSGGSNGGGKPPSVGKMVFFNILKAGFVLVCLVIIIGGIAMVPLVSYAVTATSSEDYELDLMDTGVAQTSIIMYRDANGNLQEYQKISGGESNSFWTAYGDLPKYLEQAAVATEDREFWDHGGFSIPRTIFAAMNQIIKIRPTFGGSTIDQQLVKNLTGEKTVDGDEGIKRKIREIYAAWALNKNHSKQAIMEAYLNTIPLSGTIVGASAGAREYFYKDVGELNLQECAMIIGVTNAPGRYNPYTNPENCLKRRNDVLYFMWQCEFITEAEMLAATETDLGLYEGPRGNNQTTGQVINSYFADVIYEAVVNDLAAQPGMNLAKARWQYYNGGLRIVATIDPNVQSVMESVYEQGYGSQADGFIFPEDVSAEVEKTLEDGTTVVETEHPQSAMVIIDYNGALRGVVGGIGEKTADLVFNRATGTVRQVGSTMKPIASYALAVDGRLATYSTLLEDSPSQFKNPSRPVTNPETGLPQYDWPTNYADKITYQPMAVCDALAASTNTVAVRLGERVGVDSMFEFLTDTLQISSLVREGDYNDMGLSSLVLGGMTHGISPYELAGAYQIFGNEGQFNPLHCYEQILDANGNVVLDISEVEGQEKKAQAISKEAAYIMNRMMWNVLHASGGTANGMGTEYLDSVGKTGTTSDDKDRWFVGLTPYYVGAVWWGYDTNEEIQWSASARTNPPPMVWKTVMETIQQDLPEAAFPEKPETVIEATFCGDTGYLASAACPNRRTGYYINDGTEPSGVPGTCYIHEG